MDAGAIRQRRGWGEVSAVRSGRIYAVAGVDILSPGPSLLAVLRRIHEIIQQALEG